MLTLIFAAAISILFAVFATQNTDLITLNFGGYFLPTLPIYLAILIPVLLTLLMAFVVQIARNLSTSITVRNQKNNIKTLRRDLAEVTKKLHKVELENAKLKTEHSEEEDNNSL